jgi:hypothetical protein
VAGCEGMEGFWRCREVVVGGSGTDTWGRRMNNTLSQIPPPDLRSAAKCALSMVTSREAGTLASERHVCTEASQGAGDDDVHQ